MHQGAYIKAAGAATWLLAVSTPLAWALSVAPPHTELHLAPGGTTRAVITVTNPHDEPYDVELSEKPWFIYPDNKQIQVEDWLHLPKKRHFRLKPGKSREVEIHVTCPPNATGELMGMVSFAYQGLKPSMLTPMISTAVYLDVEGTARNTGEILALGAGTQNGRFQVGVQVKATGNVRLKLNGTIRLLNDQHKEVAYYTIPETTPIFPGTIREYPANGADNPPPAGRYTLEADLLSGSLNLKATRAFDVKANGEVKMDAKLDAPEAPKS